MASEQCSSVEDVLAAADHFACLQLSIGAHTQAIVRTQYRRLALLVHPDKCSHAQAEAAFHRVVSAFEALHDLDRQADTLQQVRRSTQQRHTTTQGHSMASSSPAASGAAKEAETAIAPLTKAELYRQEAAVRLAAAQAVEAQKLRRDAKRTRNEARESESRDALRAELLSDANDIEQGAQSWRAFNASKSVSLITALCLCVTVCDDGPGRAALTLIESTRPTGAG